MECDNPRISVIVAAFNVEKYLTTAMDNLIKQTYKNIEVIAVDDGSTDSTPAILDNYEAKDERIRVIHHEKNKGLFAARKTGVAKATGDYILFLDGDDFLDKKACEVLANEITKKNVDVLQFGTAFTDIESVSEDYIEYRTRHLKPYMGETPVGEGALLSTCFVERAFSWTLWQKMWKAEVVKKGVASLSDMRLILAEDMLFCFSFLLNASSYGAIEDKLYYYRQGSGVTAPGSVIPKIKKLAETYRVITEVKRLLLEKGAMERFREVYEGIVFLLSNDVAYTLIVEVPDNLVKEACSIIFEEWPKDLICAMLGYSCFRREIITRGDLIKKFCKADALEINKNEVKTVGMFYYRYYNGGVERVSSMLTRILTEAGYRVVLFSDEEPNELDFPLPEGTERVVLPKVDVPRYSSYIARVRAIAGSIEKYGIDAFIYHAWNNYYMAVDELAVRMTGVPFILHTHSFFSVGALYAEPSINYIFCHQEDYYKLADVVVTTSEMDARWWSLLGYNGIATVNPNPFECKKIAPSVLKGKNILWVGRYSEEKRPLDAVKIMEIVHSEEPDAVLHMVGETEGAFYEEVEEYVSDNGLEDCVVFEGYSDNVEKFYSDASVMLMTSRYEGMPIVMIESKVFGLPLVCYDLPNVDMVRNSKGIAVLPQNDIDGAASEIVHILRDDSYRASMGKAARESAEELEAYDIAANWKRIFDAALHPSNAGNKSIDSDMTLLLVRSLTQGIEKWKEACDYLHSAVDQNEAAKADLYRIINELYAAIDEKDAFIATCHPPLRKRISNLVGKLKKK